jgi:hypothetical protein
VAASALALTFLGYLSLLIYTVHLCNKYLAQTFPVRLTLIPAH